MVYKSQVDAELGLSNEIFEALNPLGLQGTFVVLKSYIDESYNEDVFTLAWLAASGYDWLWINRHWKRCIDRWNRKLRKQGRKQLSRYHAVDCSNRYEEFEGWSLDEQRDFTIELTQVFKKFPTWTQAFSVELKEFYSVFPESTTAYKPDKKGFVYGMVLKYLLYTIGIFRSKKADDLAISIVHDRCDYDTVMLDAFNQVISDDAFENASFFKTIAPMGWEDCLPLQPADMVAYESFKDNVNALHGRNRRKSTEALLNIGNFSWSSVRMGREACLQLREWVQKKNKEMTGGANAQARQQNQNPAL